MVLHFSAREKKIKEIAVEAEKMAKTTATTQQLKLQHKQWQKQHHIKTTKQHKTVTYQNNINNNI